MQQKESDAALAHLRALFLVLALIATSIGVFAVVMMRTEGLL